MDQKRAKELAGYDHEEMTAGMTLTEVRYVKALWERTPGCASFAAALALIARGPDGWRVGTVVQARGIKAGPLNRWIVAAGPVPAEHDGAVLLVDEAVANTGEAVGDAYARGLGLEVPAGSFPLADYYDPGAFEPVPNQDPRR